MLTRARADAFAPSKAGAAPTGPRGDTTRLMVKNLPKYVKDEQLKKHFSKKGNVTDCKVVYTQFRSFPLSSPSSLPSPCPVAG